MMSAYLKKGIAVWILGFLTFLAALNTFHAVTLWAINGGVNYIFEPYLINNVTGGLWITTYFWASTTITFIFLGLTAIAAHRKPPLDPALARLARTFVKVEGNLLANRYKLEEQGKTIQSIHEELLSTIESIHNVKKETLAELEKQRMAIHKVKQVSNLSAKTIEKQMLKLTDMKTKLARTIKNLC